jgi:hypothetical protein
MLSGFLLSEFACLARDVFVETVVGCAKHLRSPLQKLTIRLESEFRVVKAPRDEWVGRARKLNR